MTPDDISTILYIHNICYGELHYYLLPFAAAPATKVAFRTGKDREMFPTKMAQDRFGNELCPLRGAPHRGPGCYDNEDVSFISIV